MGHHFEVVGGDPRSQRAGENEAAFRAVNERVEQLTECAEGEFVCECVRLDCAERLIVPVEEYERARSHGDRFIVAAGHEDRRFERVIDQGRGWLVVEKIGEAGQVAEETDPRT